MYEEDARSQMKKVENIEQFYANAVQEAKEREAMIPELKRMADNFVEETNNLEFQVVSQNKQLRADGREMGYLAKAKIKELEEKEDEIEERKRLHEQEVNDYIEAENKKREEVRKMNDEIYQIIKYGEMNYEKQDKQMSSNEKEIENLKEIISSKTENLVEIKQKKSLKRRLLSLFCCCFGK